MNKNRCRLSIFISAIIFQALFVLPSSVYGAAVSQRDAWGPRYQDPLRLDHGIKPRPRFGLDAVRRWNDMALDANAADHARMTPEQVGPLRTARAFAIVHIAIFDAVNAIAGGYRGYTRIGRMTEPASVDAAVARAAHDTLAELYPSQSANFDMLLAEDLSRIRDDRAKRNGIDLGRRAAAAILAFRASDGSQHDEELYGTEYVPALGVNEWRQDPVSEIPVALGSLWGAMVAPFALISADRFPISPPPAAYMASVGEGALRRRTGSPL